jgi:hypothetical protein
LIQRFQSASGDERVWIGKLLTSISIPDVDRRLLAGIREERDSRTCIALIDLLSDKAAPSALDAFGEMLPSAPPEVAAALLDAGHRLAPETFAGLNREVVDGDYPLAVKARAVGSLVAVDSARYGQLIENWLMAEDADTRKAGIVAAGVCRDARFADRLKTFLIESEDDATLLLVLDSLRSIGVSGLNPLVVLLLMDPDPRMRRAVLEVYRIDDEAALKNVIPLLGDDDDKIAELARRKILSAEYQNSLRLVKSLSLPQKKVREALFELLEEMSIKDLDVFRFVEFQARACFQLTAQAQGIRRLPENDLQHLLAVHLDERVWFALQTTLRVLAAQDRSGRMHRINRGIFSGDQRQRANSLEAMDDILDKRLVRVLMPLLEAMDSGERIAAGRRFFPDAVETQSPPRLFDSLLESRNWVTLMLTLILAGQSEETGLPVTRIEALTAHANPHVALAAGNLMANTPGNRTGQEEDMETKTSIPLTDRILHLKNIEIFSDLSINELAAVASVTAEAAFDEGEQVFQEGDRGDTLYLVLEGDVAVIKESNLDKEIELDSIGAGDYFGEMALFGDDRRSATIRVKKASRFLTLNKQELQEIVREYPQIALHVCRVLSIRIRHLHGKISDQVC